jgi:hypothetical protein
MTRNFSAASEQVLLPVPPWPNQPHHPPCQSPKLARTGTADRNRRHATVPVPVPAPVPEAEAEAAAPRPMQKGEASKQTHA